MIRSRTLISAFITLLIVFGSVTTSLFWMVIPSAAQGTGDTGLRTPDPLALAIGVLGILALVSIAFIYLSRANSKPGEDDDE